MKWFQGQRQTNSELEQFELLYEIFVARGQSMQKNGGIKSYIIHYYLYLAASGNIILQWHVNAPY